VLFAIGGKREDNAQQKTDDFTWKSNGSVSLLPSLSSLKGRRRKGVEIHQSNAAWRKTYRRKEGGGRETWREAGGFCAHSPSSLQPRLEVHTYNVLTIISNLGGKGGGEGKKGERDEEEGG